MSYQESERGELREYLEVIRARKWTILIVFILVLGGSLLLSFRQTPEYVANGRLLVTGVPVDATGVISTPSLGTEAEVVKSVEVAEIAARRLQVELSPGDLLGGLSATPVADTEVLSISYTNPDPQFATDAANAFANGYIFFKREGARSSLEPVIEDLQEKRTTALQELGNLETRLESAINAGNSDLVTRLEEQRVQTQSDVDLLAQRLASAVGTETSIALGGGEILQPASIPSTPSSPIHRTNGILGGVFGLILGLAAGFARDRLDTRFRGRVDAERTLAAPVLASVPRFKTGKKPQSIITKDFRGSASESYRTLRTNLQFLAGQQGTKSVVVTSPQSGNGKTVTTVNLGVALAQAGQRVVLISADLRRPALEKYFDLDGHGRGLSSWLQGEVTDLGAITRPTGIENVSVVVSGPVPQNPAELLTSVRFGTLIERLGPLYNFILIDSVPALALADAAITASRADAAILVIDSSSTHRSAALHAKDELERVGASLLGVVLNQHEASGSPHYYYNYYPSSSQAPSGNGSGNGASPNSPDRGRRSMFGRRR